MSKIAVMGDYNSIYGFAALGLETFPVEDAYAGSHLLRQLAGEDYGIIFITEGLAAQISSEIEKMKELIVPAIILIPGVSDNTGDGITGVKKSVEKAVGSDILFSN